MQKKFLIMFLFTLAAGLLSVQAVGAVDTTYLKDIANNMGLPQYDSFTELLRQLISILLSVIFIIAVLFAVIAGYRMVTSNGNEEALGQARRTLTWAVGGMVVVLLAWIIVWAVFTTLEKGK